MRRSPTITRRTALIVLAVVLAIVLVVAGCVAINSSLSPGGGDDVDDVVTTSPEP